jgi:hypothetical protein
LLGQNTSRRNSNREIVVDGLAGSRPDLVEFHISGSGVKGVFRLRSSPVADLTQALVRAGKHLEDEFDTAGSPGFQS